MLWNMNFEHNMKTRTTNIKTKIRKKQQLNLIFNRKTSNKSV